MMRKTTLVLFTSVLLAACDGPQGNSGIEVDTILHNGKIATIDAGLSIQSALAIKGDKIVAVGGEQLLTEFFSKNTIDLDGRFVMPGFIDSHTHLRGQPQRYIDLTETSSIEEIKSPLASYGVDGTTTLSPGVWQKYASPDWLWYSPPRIPPP